MPASSSVVVVGCGVIGLSTAVRLAEAGHAARIVTRERTPHTTSDVAAAVWLPFRGGTPEQALRWSRRSFEVFRDLLAVPEAGITWIEGIELFTGPAQSEPWWRVAVDVFRKARATELADGFEDGFVFQVPVVRMPVYLRWLEQRFLELGGVIEMRTVTDLEALSRDASVVVNCTGLGARSLTGDPDLHPIRGQIVRVAPGRVTRFLGAEDGPEGLTYIVPRADCTVLGGTEEVGSWDTTPDPAIARGIVERCTALEPALAGAAVLEHAVGLRPGRTRVRLESEWRAEGPIVHNYGHGGSGVTYSWGCAEEAARLVEKAMHSQHERRR